ncbi:hypothetical protein GY45DRAFT_1279051 [Cubamyces sp. BRFM 1775]|nr:hypothetical protein GY45DRAFT_1279051 [Cubamyces sp. BRFM 1775]
MPAPPMDVFGIVYIIETAQQFWSELEEILHIPEDCTLSKLDATLRRYISFCAAYHEQYLQSPLQLDYACDMLLNSELFAFHSERMSELLADDAQTNTDPHYEMILYSVMLSYGRRKPSFLRSQKRWQTLLPLLMDHVRWDVDPNVDDGFYGTVSGPSSGVNRGLGAPIEAKLRSLSVKLLYEVCRIQKMSLQDLKLFDDSFIDYLFDLVEQTRNVQDETFNYSVIKLIVALNEQFMVACLQPHTPNTQPGFAQQQDSSRRPEATNRVLRVLMSRAGSSPTFGENLIFMLNRADRTPEDLCMQLLILKLLYLLFTTKGMSEFFYTNDLCVLVDVFLREIGDIDEDNESLRHTYLRVLHPLLTKTQLRDMPYKRPQIVRTLESLIENESIRDVDPTTKRLVTRCLSGDWCVQFRTSAAPNAEQRKFSMWEGDIRRGESPGLDAVSSAPAPHSAGPVAGSGGMKASLDRMGSLRGKNGKASRSAEHLPLPGTSSSPPKSRSHQDPRLRADEQPYRVSSRAVPSAAMRHGSGDSASSLPRVAAAAASTHSAAVKHRHRAGSFDVEGTTTSFASLSTRDRIQELPHIIDDASPLVEEPLGGSPPEIRVLSPTSPGQVAPLSPTERTFTLSSSASTTSSSNSSKGTATSAPASPQRRAPPPPPAKKRRKPPAIPAGRTLGGAGGGPLSALAASSQPNLADLSAGVRKASGF